MASGAQFVTNFGLWRMQRLPADSWDLVLNVRLVAEDGIYTDIIRMQYLQLYEYPLGEAFLHLCETPGSAWTTYQLRVVSVPATVSTFLFILFHCRCRGPVRIF